MTNEGKKLVTETVEKTGREYPVAIIKGEDVDEAYGIRGFPTAYLLDTRGRVVWTGHPGNFEEGKLKALLAKSASVEPLPDKFKDVNKLLRKRELGKAWEAAGKALASAAGDKDLERLRADVEKALDKQIEMAEAAAKAADYGEAVAIYDEAAEVFAGMPKAADATAARKAIEADPAAKDDLAASSQLKKADAEVRKGEWDKAAPIWKAVAKKYAGTKSGERAAQALKSHNVK